jgi:hypothetical protein
MVDLGDSGDGTFSAAARVALLDADGWRDTEDLVDVRPRELLDELSRVGIHRIEESSLAFRVEESEGERALARTAYARDDDETAAGDPE